LSHFFIISAVPKCIAHDVVIKKGISLIYIILMAIVTSPCSLSIPFGKGVKYYSLWALPYCFLLQNS